MATSYRVEKGLNYNQKRAEPGDIIDDLPTSAIDELLAIQAISLVTADTKTTQRGK